MIAQPFPNQPPLNHDNVNPESGNNNVPLAAGINSMALALASINQSRADDAAAKVASTPKSGFDSFPANIRRMILNESQQANEDGSVLRTEPIASYAEIIAFPNASYVQSHLHNVLRSDPLNRDVHLPTGFCAAVKTASLLSPLNDQKVRQQRLQQ